MTPKQQRKMLECAAKACGIDGWYSEQFDLIYLANDFVLPYAIDRRWWNPKKESADTAEMCAKLEIGTEWVGIAVRCFCENVEIDAHFKDHDNSRLMAWMFAATMVAAKIGGYEE